MQIAIVLADTAAAKQPAPRDEFAGGGTNVQFRCCAGLTFGLKAGAPTRSFSANAGYPSKPIFLDMFAFVFLCQSITVLCAFVALSQSLSLFVKAFKYIKAVGLPSMQKRAAITAGMSYVVSRMSV